MGRGTRGQRAGLGMRGPRTRVIYIAGSWGQSLHTCPLCPAKYLSPTLNTHDELKFSHLGELGKGEL